jgi:hypothetical protein
MLTTAHFFAQNIKFFILNLIHITMKKLVLLLSFIAPLLGLAQSATILPNAVGVPKVAALATCNSTEKGKQVLNTTDNKMYYCNGTNWQEMTGGGFTIPYSDTANTISNLLYLENTGNGRAIFGKSISASAVRAESETGYGVFALSDSYFALYATSNSGVGVYGGSNSDVGVRGFSGTNYAAYFSASGDNPTLYVTSAEGEAADFRGSVKIRDKLIVDDNKGIVRSNSATQQKIVRMTGSLAGTNLAAGAYLDSGGFLNYEDFGGIPTVTVGQVLNTSAEGDWYKVLIVPTNVTATNCQMRMFNTSGGPITFSGTWHFLIVGPE